MKVMPSELGFEPATFRLALICLWAQSYHLGCSNVYLTEPLYPGLVATSQYHFGGPLASSGCQQPTKTHLRVGTPSLDQA